jgi:valyl-tRNA synthetase
VTRATLARVLETTLRLMHPVIPFVTEELWQKVPKPGDRGDSIVVAPWPKADAFPRDAEAETQMAALQAAISSIRTVRTEHEISPANPVHVRLCTANDALRALLKAQATAVRTLAKVEPLEIPETDLKRPAGFATSPAGEIEVQVLLRGLVTPEHETARIERELKKHRKDLEATQKKLSQPSFTDKAPPEVVAEARARVAELEGAIAALEAGRGLTDELKG